jgi:nucleoside-diphosphate-sugar epimerase
MILVTGGTGQTGQFVIQELGRRGRAVRVLARPQSAAQVSEPGVEIALGDLGDRDSLHRAMAGVSGVVHTACTFSDSRIDVYGVVEGGPIGEDHPLSDQLGDYARGKIVCERLLSEAAARSGRSDYGMLRAPYIWAPHPKARRMVLNQRVIEGRPLILPGITEAEWSAYRDVWIDVRDLAWVVAECLDRPPSGPLNVLSGHYSWHDLHAELVRLTASPSPIIHRPLAEITEEELPDKSSYARTWLFDDTLLVRKLAYVPRYSFHQSLHDLVRAG